jgi:hypothetical protein
LRRAVLVLRRFLGATRIAQLAADNAIALSTAYARLHEGIDVLAGHPRGACSGATYLNLDGTLIYADCIAARSPERRGSVVERETQTPWRQHPGPVLPGWLPQPGLGCKTRPGTRHYLREERSWLTRCPDRSGLPEPVARDPPPAQEAQGR